MEIIAEYGQLFIIIGCVVGFFMAWGIGANDVANAMGTSVGSRALTLGQAVMVACIFEFAGAYLAGGEVTSTIRKGIIEVGVISDSPELLIYGMTSALLAAGIWLLIASYFGWPVSTTHSIVGAIVGFAAVGISVDVVNWGKVASIVASWVVSPVLAGTISFLLFTSVRRLILQSDNPFMSAKRYVPFYMFLAGFTVAMVTFLKGLKHVGLEFTASESIAWALVIALVISLIGTLLLQKIDDSIKEKNGAMFNGVERVFAVLMIFTACAMAFAHGSNDVANAIGPLAAIVSDFQSGGEIAAKSGAIDWCIWDRNRSRDAWLSGHENNWNCDYRVDSKQRVCCRVSGCRYSGDCIRNGSPNINHAYARWGSAWCRSCKRHWRHQSGCCRENYTLLDRDTTCWCRPHQFFSSSHLRVHLAKRKFKQKISRGVI